MSRPTGSAVITERVSELTLQYNALIMEYLSYDEETEKIGALYRELVDLHNEEAQIVGYKDYADYAYEASYGRDFTPDDAAALCEAVKPYARQYFGSLYYNEATYADFSADTDLTERELVGLVTQYMPRVSDDAAKAAAYMEKHGCTSWTALSASAISASPRRSTSICPLHLSRALWRPERHPEYVPRVRPLLRRLCEPRAGPFAERRLAGHFRDPLHRHGSPFHRLV